MVSQTALIIGLPGEDPTGLMYERALLDKGLSVRWESMDDMLAIIQRRNCPPFDGKGPVPFRRDEYFFSDAWLQAVDLGFLVSNRHEKLSSAVNAALACAGVITPNAPEAVHAANDKWQTYSILHRADLATPYSVLVSSTDELISLRASMKLPLVLKQPDGNRGDNVFLVRSTAELERVFSILHAAGEPVLVQHYVECNASDKRIIVMDGEVIAAMSRHGRNGDFRSNLAQGGVARKTVVSDAEAKLALCSAQALGLRFAGLDIATVAETLDGREYLSVGDPFCLEANAMPALDMPLVYGGVDGSVRLVQLMLDQLASESGNGSR